MDTTVHIAFDIQGDITLILGNGITLKGSSDGRKPLVNLNEAVETRGKAELIMKEGSAITDNGGGGVAVQPSGSAKFYMESGVIYGSEAAVGLANKALPLEEGEEGVATHALFVGEGGSTAAEYGKYNDACTWVKTAVLTSSAATVRVEKGVKK